jgi:predicted nucleotidyltransferase
MIAMQAKNSVSDFQSKLRANLPDLQKKYGVRGLWVFGSRLRVAVLASGSDEMEE